MPIYLCPYWQPGTAEDEDELPDTSGTAVHDLIVIWMCHSAFEAGCFRMKSYLHIYYIYLHVVS